MRRIVYAGTTFLTGDDLAASLLDYARALARKGSSDTVALPARMASGSVETVQILIGPASQLVSEPADLEGPEIEDAAAVAELHRRSAEASQR
jgi:hypothetical protein